jgi:hypothetical protein
MAVRRTHLIFQDPVRPSLATRMGFHPGWKSRPAVADLQAPPGWGRGIVDLCRRRRRAMTRFAVPLWRKEPSSAYSLTLLVRGKQLSTHLQDLQRPPRKRALDGCRASGQVTRLGAASTRDNRPGCPGDARPVIPWFFDAPEETFE